MNTVHRKFGSWGEFVATAADLTRHQWQGKRSSQMGCDDRWPYGSDMNATWFGGSFDDAVTLATRGWPQGLKKLRAVHGSVPTHRAMRAAIHYDVGGDLPDIGRAIAGDPMNMTITRPSRRAAVPIIAIVMHIGVSSRINASSIIAHGAAVMSYIDALETAGYRTELHVHDSASTSWGRFYITIPVKRAEEHLDRDRTMYATTHPSVLRRLCFAICEQSAELEPTFSMGYGRALENVDYPDDDLPHVINLHTLDTNVTAARVFDPYLDR